MALGGTKIFISQLSSEGIMAIKESWLEILLEFALKINGDPSATTDEDVEELRSVGLSDKGLVQLVHYVSHFASYNRLNLSLNTDYDYRHFWNLCHH